MHFGVKNGIFLIIVLCATRMCIGRPGEISGDPREYAIRRIATFISTFLAATPRSLPWIPGLPPALLESIMKHIHIKAGHYADYEGYNHQVSLSDDNWLCGQIRGPGLPPALQPMYGYPCNVAYHHVIVPTLYPNMPIHVYLKEPKVIVHQDNSGSSGADVIIINGQSPSTPYVVSASNSKVTRIVPSKRPKKPPKKNAGYAKYPAYIKYNYANSFKPFPPTTRGSSKPGKTVYVYHHILHDSSKGPSPKTNYIGNSVPKARPLKSQRRPLPHFPSYLPKDSKQRLRY